MLGVGVGLLGGCDACGELGLLLEELAQFLLQGGGALESSALVVEDARIVPTLARSGVGMEGVGVAVAPQAMGQQLLVQAVVFGGLLGDLAAALPGA